MIMSKKMFYIPSKRPPNPKCKSLLMQRVAKILFHKRVCIIFKNKGVGRG